MEVTMIHQSLGSAELANELEVLDRIARRVDNAGRLLNHEVLSFPRASVKHRQDIGALSSSS
jgi:hypothetical protein